MTPSLLGARLRRADWLPPVAAVAGLILLAVYAFRAVVADPLRLPGIDAPIHFAWEVHTRAALASGEFPHWDPSFWAGRPHFADTLTIVLYPPAFLFRWLPPHTFLQWMALAHLVFAGGGTLFLTRVIGLSWWSAAAAAIAVTVGGAAGSWLHLGHLTVVFTVAWLPWALALSIVSARRASAFPHPALPIVLVLQLLAGHLHFSLYVVGAVGGYYLYSLAWPELQAVRRWQVLAQLAVTAALVAGLSAFQLLPLRELVAEAARLQGLPYERAAAGGWALRDLATFFFPLTGVDQEPVFRFLSHRVAYVGWLLVCAIPFAFMHGRYRRIVFFFALLALGAIGVAMGDHGPLYRVHYLLFPGLRIPGRVLFVATLSVAVLGAIGLERYVAAASERRWRTVASALGVSMVIVIVAALAAWQGAQSDAGPPSHLWPWIPVLTVAGLALSGFSSSRQRRGFAIALCLTLIVVDLSAFAGAAPLTVPIEPQETLQRWVGPADTGRVWSLCPNRVDSNEMQIARRSGLRGPGGLTLASYNDWFELTELAERPEDVLGAQRLRRDLIDSANVTTVLSCEPLVDGGLSLVARVAPVYIYRNDRAWPRATWACGAVRVPRAVVAQELRLGRFTPAGTLARQPWMNIRWVPGVSDEQRRALEARYGLAGGVARERDTWRYVPADMSGENLRALVHDAAVEDTHGVHRETGELFPEAAIDMPEPVARATETLVGTGECDERADVHVVHVDDAHGRVAAEVDAPAGGGVVLFSEPFYPARQAFVDGEPVEAEPANLAFTAVRVPAGRHRVELRLVPQQFYAGLGVSAMTAMAWSGAAWFGRRRRRPSWNPAGAGPASSAVG